jgi:AcrR family transcriptional regulator
MTSTKEQIAYRLEQAFNTHGFAELSVATLQKVVGASLRTLYRYFPSKQAMVIGVDRRLWLMNFSCSMKELLLHGILSRQETAAMQAGLEMPPNFQEFKVLTLVEILLLLARK